MNPSYLPIFVVSAPHHLKIWQVFLNGLGNRSKLEFGFLINSCTASKNLKTMFANFPEKNGFPVKIGDSGIFHGDSVDCHEIFSIYEELHVGYGIINDSLNDSHETNLNAYKSKIVYERNGYGFRLVGVAQGKNIDDYISSYHYQREIGYENIAFGGLLAGPKHKRRIDDKKLSLAVEKVRKEYGENEWLFALGAYGPARIDFLKGHKIWADSKRWLFQYKRKKDTVTVNRFSKLVRSLEKNFYEKQAWLW